MRQRIVFEYDPDPAARLDYLEQWNTPGKYAGNEVLQSGKPVPWDEYRETWGNPDRHVVLCARIEVECPACGHWETADALYGIDIIDWEPYEVGTFAPDKLGDLPEFQQEIATDMFQEVTS